MPINEQPSILTVCVPGVGAEPGVLDLKEILAARAVAALKSGCSRSVSNDNAPSAKCDACDDSACGVDGVSDSARDCAGLRNRMGDATPCDLDRGDLDRRISADETVDDARGETGPSGGPSFFHADSGKKALELLRMLRFDLLVTGDRLPDMPVSHLIGRVRAAWPWQKWAMVGASITTQDEIVARTLGAVAVFDAPPDWDALGALAVAALNSDPSQSRNAYAMQMAGSPEKSKARREIALLGSSLPAARSRRSAGDGATAAGSGRRNGSTHHAAAPTPQVPKRSVG
jgi:hypothetical protein